MLLEMEQLEIVYIYDQMQPSVKSICDGWLLIFLECNSFAIRNGDIFQYYKVLPQGSFRKDGAEKEMPVQSIQHQARKFPWKRMLATDSWTGTWAHNLWPRKLLFLAFGDVHKLRNYPLLNNLIK